MMHERLPDPHPYVWMVEVGAQQIVDGESNLRRRRFLMKAVAIAGPSERQSEPSVFFSKVYGDSG